MNKRLEKKIILKSLECAAEELIALAPPDSGYFKNDRILAARRVINRYNLEEYQRKRELGEPSEVLNEKEQDDLISLGEDIQANLSCDANGTGLPCRTDRLEAVSNMKRYLEIHGYRILSSEPDSKG
jgi:hypothetical protein